MMTSLADSVASDGEVSSCRFSGRGSVSRFLADQRRESIDSGLTADSGTFQTDIRRASDPLLNNCGVAPETAPAAQQRCHSSASAPGTAWHGHRIGGSVVAGTGSSRGAAPSLMSSRSSIATNMSDDVDVKYTPPNSVPSVADQVVGDLLIPDEMREFINRTYGSPAVSAAVSLNADSTVADSPAAPVDSTSGLDDPAGKPAEGKPTPLTSCMYEGQAGGNSAQPLGNSAQPQLAGAVGEIHNAAAALPASGGPPRPFDAPTSGSSTSYFRSPGVPQAYQNAHEVQVSQVSQSWRPESVNYGSAYRGSGGMADLAAEDLAVRHRRNPHQMNWWSRTYGYQHANPPGGYRPNYTLPPPSIHLPRTAASFVPSQTSPSCNQVCLHSVRLPAAIVML